MSGLWNVGFNVVFGLGLMGVSHLIDMLAESLLPESSLFVGNTAQT